MGTDKALLLWDGIPLLQRVCQVAMDCCGSVHILTPWPQRYQSLLQPGWQLHLEAQPGQGPLVALNQGLQQIDQDWILLLACDLPCLEVTVIRNWINRLQELPETTQALVPYDGDSLGDGKADRWQPLCGFYRRRVQPELQQFIAQGGRSFQAWLAQVEVEPLFLSAGAEPMLWNCNTPEDLWPQA